MRNRNFAKAKQHAEMFGTLAVSLEQAVQADIIFSCLPTAQDVENLLAPLQPKVGSIWVDCTSGIPSSAQKLQSELAAKGVQFWMPLSVVKPLGLKMQL